MTDPTTDTLGAGASANFTGNQDAARNFKQTAGVVEGRPGIIESTNIDPLNENSNKGTSRPTCTYTYLLTRAHGNSDDGWANARSTGSGIGATATSIGSTAASTAGAAASTAASAAMSAANMAAGAARMAYGHAVGDEQTKQAGKEAVWGKQ